jgi:hypothetical protein
MKHDADAAPESTPAARRKPTREGPKLNDEHREYIGRRLATYVRPSQCGGERWYRADPPAIDHYD